MKPLAKPLMIDLFAGLGGWAEGGLAEGYDVVGFDIERHQYGEHRYPAQLVIQDVTTLHGSQFKSAALIVASPPCQGYSYRAMPWKRAKALPPPDNTLFETCFRIQREACEAAGRHIPLIVENVRGAQKWVGRARWNFGSFYLWGDVPALMPMTLKTVKVPGFRFDGSGKSFQSAAVEETGFKTQGMNWSDQTKRGQDFTRIAGKQAMRRILDVEMDCKENAVVDASMSMQVLSSTDERTCRGLPEISLDGRKNPNRIVHIRDAAPHTKHLTNPDEHTGIKQHGSGREWFAGDGKISRMTSSQSSARKMASAMIAKIPLPLSRYIAATYRPDF